MKPRIPIIVALFMLSALPIMPGCQSVAAPASRTPMIQQWEYAGLRYDDPGDAYNCHFTTAQVELDARDANDMLRQLGGPEVAPQNAIKADLILFSYIGSKGWELVCVAPKGPWGANNNAMTESSTGAGRIYLFKRPVVKERGNPKVGIAG